jgi:hypothetical protein
MNDNMVFLKFALEIIRENAILKYWMPNILKSIRRIT